MSVSFVFTTHFPTPPLSLVLSKHLLVHSSNAHLSSRLSSVSSAFVLSMSPSFLSSTRSAIWLYSGSHVRLEHTFVPCVSIWVLSLALVGTCRS